MTNNLTQKRMINIFANNTGDFYWRLKYLRLRAIRNPVDKTAFNAKHKWVLPILSKSKGEHGYEILSLFLAYFSRKHIFSYFMKGLLCVCEKYRKSHVAKYQTYTKTWTNQIKHIKKFSWKKIFEARVVLEVLVVEFSEFNEQLNWTGSFRSFRFKKNKL